MKDVKLYDTTLRDGAQTEGISYSVNDKLRITEKLAGLGIHYIEGGWPGSNPKDMQFFKAAKKLKLKNSGIVAFGSTRRANTAISRDAIVRGLLDSGTKHITIFGKSWDMHVRDVFKVPLEENLKMISETVSYLKSKGKTVFYDAEHFFDGYKSDPDFAAKTLFAARDAGADCIILCDTNGGTITSDLVDTVKEVLAKLDCPVGIHCHNDCAMAVANSIAAVQAGCAQVQGTFNGYGERCGNADLAAVIGNLKLKLGINCVTNAQLKELTETSRFIAEISNVKQQENQPFVGNSAFTHKAGVHINAIMKNPVTYEHIDPRLVGNKRRLLVSELSGKTSILLKAEALELDLNLTKEAPKTKKILKLLQKLEHEGYHFEAAEGSLELLLKRAFKKYKRFFELEGFKVVTEHKGNKLLSEATIKVKVNKVEEHTAAEGDGPINALDNALRKALLEFYPALAEMRLSDFKVRVLDEKAGTAAKVRVLIQSEDAKDSWWTIGVSENIIEASWNALVDSIEYKLLKDRK
ncbi:MAG: citramalate synthase [Candidatus Omnitrophica bacterium]|nr:citramalate synthase [Candidatus Omnitrophota bacterium]MDD5310932.1 citramalate synthase [Candidatus Omnitrophota bacterium]MDD5545794.1 citramalate synthase [Candidatus Omnitrophota bacterium]